ncbi:MAG TPA: hypothetical protein H9685_05785 [Firmicutes bacterium]|nr:hypothetical protein [Bacillota bacterium]
MNKKIALLIAAIVAATSFQISFADEYDRRADAADEIIVSASSDAGEKQSDELMQSPDPDTTAQPEATTGAEPTPAASPDSSAEPATTPAASPDASEEPEATDRPETTPTAGAEPSETPEPYGVWESECADFESVTESQNVSLYEIVESDRPAFYNDFTTYQKSGGGTAYLVFEIPYMYEFKMTSYFFTGEEVRDFTFEKSLDGATWTTAEASCEYTTADGKWTQGDYTLSGLGGNKYIKVTFPESTNWWTPLIASARAALEKPTPQQIVIEGATEIVVPKYDSESYMYTAKILDSMGNEFDAPISLSVESSDIEGLAIDENGTVEILSSYEPGASFRIIAEAEDIDLVGYLDATLFAPVAGDANGDLRVTEEDLDLVTRYFGVDSESSRWLEIRNADVNGDGLINIIDIAYIAKVYEPSSADKETIK